MDKEFWKEAFKHFGISVIFAVMLIVYYGNENKKWEQYTANDQVRWETLLKKYSEDQKQSMRAIQACCMDRLHRLPPEQANGGKDE